MKDIQRQNKDVNIIEFMKFENFLRRIILIFITEQDTMNFYTCSLTLTFEMTDIFINKFII